VLVRIPFPQPDATAENETHILQSVGTVSVIQKQALRVLALIFGEIGQQR
jgi:hypothetical protein